MYVLLLGLDVLGNPFGLITGLKDGAVDFFYEPYQVWRPSRTHVFFPSCVCSICGCAEDIEMIDVMIFLPRH